MAGAGEEAGGGTGTCELKRDAPRPQLLTSSGDGVAACDERQAANPAPSVSGEINIAILGSDDNEPRWGHR